MKNPITCYENCSNGIIVKTEKHSVLVLFLTDNIIRVKYCFSGEISKDRSYAALLTAGPVDNGLYGCEEKQTVTKIIPEIVEDEDNIHLSRWGTRICLNKKDFAVDITNAAGRTVHSDLPGRAYYLDGNNRRYHYVRQQDYDKYYGFGEKTGELNKYKTSLRMYSNDTMGYDPEKADPLYKHIPFFIKLNKSCDSPVGVFYDVTRPGVFDLGREHSNYWDKYIKFCCDSGDLDYYVILGQDIKEIIRRYTDLTGKTILPPYFSLGYMASSMYYTELERDSDKGILEFTEELAKEDLNCDGFHLSSGYTSIGNKRCVFNWNRERFPQPEDFVRAMHDKRIFLSPNIKPALLTSNPLYKEFEEAGAFIRDEAGRPCLESFWGGMASFVDFTSPSGREMWKKYLTKQLIDYGIYYFWDDNNEYEFFNEKAPEKAVLLKPVFANLMAKTAIEALASNESTKDLRPYILSRGGYAGIQRYAQTWAGDNYTSWKALRYNIPTMLGMSLSGVANQGCDVGGFYGPSPDAELFVRWVQNGIFQPRFCIHSCNNDNTVTQPWSYGEEYTEYIRDAFKLRYSLGPYLYSLFYEASTLGDPVMRPMVYEFQQDMKVCEESFDFMLGPFLLVANVLEKGQTERSVYLPEGYAWYDFYTHEKYDGGQTITLPAPMGRIPMLYRAGAILPFTQPGKRMDMENIRELRLLIEPSVNSSFTLYQDDGKTTAYKSGESLTTQIQVESGKDSIHISFNKKGSFKDLTKRIEAALVCEFKGPLKVDINGRKLSCCINKSAFDKLEAAWYFDIARRHLLVKYPNPEDGYMLHVDFAEKDLIGM